STTPSFGLTMAVSGTGGGSATRLSALRASLAQTRVANFASGAKGVATGSRIGLDSVTTRATSPGLRLAISRAIVPPRLRPTSEAGRPHARAVSLSLRSNSATMVAVGPMLGPQSQE